MDFQAQEQLELERLEILYTAFDKLDTLVSRGSLDEETVLILRGECGLTEKVNG